MARNFRNGSLAGARLSAYQRTARLCQPAKHSGLVRMKYAILATALLASPCAFAMSQQNLDEWSTRLAEATVANQLCQAKIDLKQIEFIANVEGLTDSDMRIVKQHAAAKVALIKSTYAGKADIFCTQASTETVETEFAREK